MVKLLRGPDSDWFRGRINLAMLVVVLAFLILMSRLFYLQVVEGDSFRKLSENNCIRKRTVTSPRGLVFDRNGAQLVDNRPSFDLQIIPQDARPIKETLNRLSEYLNIPVDELMIPLEKAKGLPSYKPVILKKDIGWDLMSAVEVKGFDIPGIQVAVNQRRYYMEEGVAAHILGYIGEISLAELESENLTDYRTGDSIGKAGIEKSFERILRGKRGEELVEVNASGMVVKVINSREAAPGDNVFLSIDINLQKRAEALLAGKAASLVAVDTATGQILVLASSPSYDQNVFIGGISGTEWRNLVGNPLRPLENKVIQAEYPPASTYKIITAMAGLEEGVVDRNTSFFCGGQLKHGDRYFRCWKKGGHGQVDIVDAMAESCDVYFYHVGQRLGVDRIAWYARASGLGQLTGIDLDHEEKGLVPSSIWKRQKKGVPWHSGETLSISIGQGYNLATPLQMLGVVAAVANKGVRLKPRLLKSVTAPDGEVLYDSKPEVIGHLPASPASIQIIRDGLFEVVNTRRGTAWLARLPDITVYGKTGTAQVVGRKGDGPERYADHQKPHAWFVAFSEKEGSPGIAVSVMVEHGEHGSSGAAPIARDIIRQYIDGVSGDSKSADKSSAEEVDFPEQYVF